VEDAAQAEEFLGAEERHDPFGFADMERVVGLVLDAIERDCRITVYGDFDCDGVCATAILVGAVRSLGGTCDWFIPDRIADGYGLNEEAIRKIADRGTSLVLTVDCGVTAVDEVALARELGLEIVVTDHHQTGPGLPDCPILHPRVSGYPFPDLCGAAVAGKLASALRAAAGSDPREDEGDLDLVALATVTDVMPLTGENRSLVRRGVKIARLARRLGMAALMEDAGVEPQHLSSEDFGFRLGPRINAAGRMYRADAGVELFLAESRERAAEIARELTAANAERRRVEREVEGAARAALREQDETGPAIVVAGEGWHPGVVGIVASRLVRSEGRPAVVISLEGDLGRGSARGVPGLDLHSALGDVSGLLESFGGHAAAAGVSIRADRLEEFRRALGSAVAERIGSEPVEPVIEFDAVAGGPELGLDLAEEIERLAPFGNANPPVRLLVPAARIADVREMGEGKHCRFTVRSGSHRAAGVAFDCTGFGVGEEDPVDVIAELGVNRWNGSIEPRLLVEEVIPVPEATPLEGCGEEEWWERFELAYERGAGPDPGPRVAEISLGAISPGPPGAALAELISSGERIAVVTADAQSRWRSLGGREGLGRFAPVADAAGSPRPEPEVHGIWAGSPRAAVRDAGRAGVLLTDFASLLSRKAPGLAGFDRIALIDPPCSEGALSLLREAGAPVHFLAGPEEFAFAARVAAHRFDLTSQLRALYRGLREAGTSEAGPALRRVLSEDGKLERSPEEAAVLLRVLSETGHARTDGRAGARTAGVVSSVETKLSESTVFAAHLRFHEEQIEFLNRLNRLTRPG